MLCNVVLSVISSFVIISLMKKNPVAEQFINMLLRDCQCSVALPRGACLVL